MAIERRITLITGASGGIGAACAECIGRSAPIFLTDIDPLGLLQTVKDLIDKGIDVAGHATCDLGADGAIEDLLARIGSVGVLAGVLHVAGLAPTQGDATAIMRLNSYATALLLDAVEAKISDEFAAVVISSMAGHLAPPDARLDALCANPLEPGFFDKVIPLLIEKSNGDADRGAAVNAYLYSKRGNLLNVRLRAVEWARKGARINSISPGIVKTRVGQLEVEVDENASAMLDMQPLGWVYPDAIGDAADFLLSPKARAITGTDLKVDGGTVAAILGNAAMASDT